MNLQGRGKYRELRYLLEIWQLFSAVSRSGLSDLGTKLGHGIPGAMSGTFKGAFLIFQMFGWFGVRECAEMR